MEYGCWRKEPWINIYQSNVIEEKLPGRWFMQRKNYTKITSTIVINDCNILYLDELYLFLLTFIIIISSYVGQLSGAPLSRRQL